MPGSNLSDFHILMTVAWDQYTLQSYIFTRFRINLDVFKPFGKKLGEGTNLNLKNLK